MRPQPLAGMRVAFAGKFSLFQYQIAELIEEAGGTCVDYVDRSTSLLVSGEPSLDNGKLSVSHQSKMSAAKSNKVPITNEDGLEKILKPYVEYDPKEYEKQEAEKLKTRQNYGEW